MMGNYLRVRGEYPEITITLAEDTELPPRARRIRFHLAADQATRGTTSACAENTGFKPCAPVRNWNYLRVRGEYMKTLAQKRENMELPPRARRILLKHQSDTWLRGTTSACAENTLGCTHWGYLPRNYLRVRGEYRSATTNRSRCWELPPRARRIPPRHR